MVFRFQMIKRIIITCQNINIYHLLEITFFIHIATYDGKLCMSDYNCMRGVYYCFKNSSGLKTMRLGDLYVNSLCHANSETPASKD